MRGCAWEGVRQGEMEEEQDEGAPHSGRGTELRQQLYEAPPRSGKVVRDGVVVWVGIGRPGARSTETRPLSCRLSYLAALGLALAASAALIGHAGHLGIVVPIRLHAGVAPHAPATVVKR